MCEPRLGVELLVQAVARVVDDIPELDARDLWGRRLLPIIRVARTSSGSSTGSS